MSFNVHAENQIFLRQSRLRRRQAPGVAKLLLGLATPCGAPGGWRCVAEAISFLLMPDEIRSWCALRTSNYVREIYYVPIGWRCQSNVNSAVRCSQVIDFIRKNSFFNAPNSLVSRTFTTQPEAFFMHPAVAPDMQPARKNCYLNYAPVCLFCRRLHRRGARYA
jgi:hypothetical protein